MLKSPAPEGKQGRSTSDILDSFDIVKCREII